MNIKKYNKEIQSLNKKMLEQKRSIDPRIFETLSALMEKAEELNDNNLLGYVHYHLADSLYTFEVDYVRFKNHLAKAISYFQSIDDKEMLVRSYNYVGIDASNNGSYDVAYYHFMNALDIAEDINSPYLLGIVNGNIGQIFANIHDYHRALDYLHSSSEQQLEGDPNDVYYYQNIINGYFSEGVINVFLGNIEEARRLDNEIRKIEKNKAVKEVANGVIPISFLRLQLAILEGKEDLVDLYSKQALEMISKAHRIYDFIIDIRDLCMFLIEYNRLEIVRNILDTISETIESTNINEMHRHLENIELAYYEKIGDDEKIVKHLRNLHNISKIQENEQIKIYEFSIDLINSMLDLNKEKEILKSKAEIDTLTGIPNRGKMEQFIEIIFEKAYKEKQKFAIGIIDIDRFKEYNDTYGSVAGDKILKRISKRIQAVAKTEKLHLARYGGDELLIIYDNKSDTAIKKIAEKIYKTVYDMNIEHINDPRTKRVTVSQGICNDIPKGKIKSWEFLVEADDALYKVKNAYYSKKKYSPIKITHLPK